MGKSIGNEQLTKYNRETMVLKSWVIELGIGDWVLG